MADGTKLSIDLNNATIQVEGDADLAREIYQDFRHRLAEYQAAAPAAAEPVEDEQGAEQATSKGTKGKGNRASTSKRSSARKRTSGSKSGQTKSRVGDYKPQFDPNLDLGDLPEFYAQFEPKNHSEKILVFVEYLREKFKKESLTADEIFSCYWTLRDQKIQMPNAYVQAFRDAQNKAGFIEFNSTDDIRLTLAGANHFSNKLKQAAAE